MLRRSVPACRMPHAESGKAVGALIGVVRGNPYRGVL